MNEKNTAQLLTDFPRLFRAPDNADDHSIVRQWGFEHADGWFPLVYKLCADIEQAALEAGLNPASTDWPRVVQVKEKFGTLRFYIRTPSVPQEPPGLSLDCAQGPSGFMAFRPLAGVPKIRELVAAAEEASGTICETCGAPGELRRGGWWHTKCDQCEARYLQGKGEHHG